MIDISKTKLEVIPDYAFYESDNLHELQTPVTLRKVGAYAFYGCNNLNEVKFLGKTLEEIGTGAFKTCNNLHIVDIPEGVTAIADGTFDGCQNLNTIKLPDSLKTIGDNAFKDCRISHRHPEALLLQISGCTGSLMYLCHSDLLRQSCS